MISVRTDEQLAAIRLRSVIWENGVLSYLVMRLRCSKLM